MRQSRTLTPLIKVRILIPQPQITVPNQSKRGHTDQACTAIPINEAVADERRKHLPHRIAASDIYQRDERGSLAQNRVAFVAFSYAFCD
jgi:hypothetical protein